MNERDALKWLMLSRPLVPDDWWYHQQDRGAWKDVVETAQAALEAPSEMQQLVEWLEGELVLAREHQDHYGGNFDWYYGGQEIAFKDALDHIRTEFLGEEK